MNEIIGIIPHKFRRWGFGVACTLLLRAGLNFLGLAALLPVLAKLCRLDPAIMAQPLITTIMDTCSVFIFFNVAMFIMSRFC